MKAIRPDDAAPVGIWVRLVCLLPEAATLGTVSQVLMMPITASDRVEGGCRFVQFSCNIIQPPLS
jgi:hypothetical protein